MKAALFIILILSSTVSWAAQKGYLNYSEPLKNCKILSSNTIIFADYGLKTKVKSGRISLETNPDKFGLTLDVVSGNEEYPYSMTFMGELNSRYGGTYEIELPGFILSGKIVATKLRDIFTVELTTTNLESGETYATLYSCQEPQRKVKLSL